MFIKHIGKHSDRKVAVVFKKVPDEGHMALVVYTEVLRSDIHDALMRAIETPQGQEASDLAEVLHRTLLPDGRPMLVALHKEGMIKKVPTSQILMTPNASSTIRLDELNKILEEMNQGEAAFKKLAELDASSGFVDPKVKRAAEAAFKASQADKADQARADKAQALVAPSTGGLDDASIARDLRNQALRMETEAKSLLAESARLLKEAGSLDGVSLESKPRRGRPPKVTTLQTADVSQ